MLTKQQIEDKLIEAFRDSIKVQGNDLLTPPNNKGIPLWFIVLQLFEFYNDGDRHIDLCVPIRNGSCGKLYSAGEKFDITSFLHLVDPTLIPVDPDYPGK